MTGFVYAIGDGEGRVKIGWSGDPIRRLRGIQTGCPQNAKLIGMVRATKSQESQAHKLLARWHIKGDWFRFEGAVAVFVGMLPLAGPRAVAIESNPRIWRRNNGLTLADVAIAIGISGNNPSATYARYERGLNAAPAKIVEAIMHLSAGAVTAASWQAMRMEFLGQQEEVA